MCAGYRPVLSENWVVCCWRLLGTCQDIKLSRPQNATILLVKCGNCGMAATVLHHTPAYNFHSEPTRTQKFRANRCEWLTARFAAAPVIRPTRYTRHDSCSLPHASITPTTDVMQDLDVAYCHQQHILPRTKINPKRAYMHIIKAVVSRYWIHLRKAENAFVKG